MAAAGALRDFLGLLGSLHGFFAEPLTFEAARAVIRTRVEQRDGLFLAMARTTFLRPGSPYHTLLGLAGCAYRDLELLVGQRGVDSALRALQREGVYLSFEEYAAGEARRGEHLVRFRSSALDGPMGPGALTARTGGTRSQGRWINFHIDNLADQSAPQFAVALEMFAGRSTPSLVWHLGFPSGAGLAACFALARLHRAPRRWFTLAPMPRAVLGPKGHHRLFVQAARLQAARAGIRLPTPEHIPVGQVGRVLDAVRVIRQEDGRCLIYTTPSCAVRLAAEARRCGVSLENVTVLTSAEPLTRTKAEEIRKAGGHAFSFYASAEAGLIGAPCGHPHSVDDVHLRSDALAMITAERDFYGVPLQTVMLTSLLPSRRALLNVEIDDFAQVLEQRCGCLWDELGCGPHLMNIRSFTKLTGEGTTLVGSHTVRIIEQVLPQAFGGSSTDYQLVEMEDPDALTGLFLMVSPRVGPVDEPALVHRFTEALRATAGPSLGPGGGMRQVWEQAQSIRVLRREPIPTSLGKLLPFRTLGARDAAALSGQKSADI